MDATRVVETLDTHSVAQALQYSIFHLESLVIHPAAQALPSSISPLPSSL